LLAQQVRDVLLEYTHLTSVLWFDDDMTGTSAHVRLMMYLSEAFSVAITGVYCKHSSQRLLTARRYPGDAERIVLDNIELMPVLAGMGCMLVPADQFLGVWDCSPEFGTHTGKKPLRAICASGPVRDAEGTMGWVSEDQVYSQALWQYARGVYLAPIPWGHLTEVPLYPLADAKFLSGDEDYSGVVQVKGTPKVSKGVQVKP